MTWLLWLLSGCCGSGAPTWLPIDDVYLDGEPATIDLSAYALDDGEVDDLVFDADTDSDLITEVSGATLTLTPQPGWRGETTVRLVATDACDNNGVTEILVSGAEDPDGPGPGEPGDCSTVITHRPTGTPTTVSVAGSFNEWVEGEDELTDNGDGTWSVVLDLDPGAYTYKLVEDGQWLCDPEADLVQCDEGYKEPWETDWAHECAPGVGSCNSMLVVPECGPPQLQVSALDIDREGGAVSVTVDARVGSGGAIEAAEATLDGAPLDGTWDGERFRVDLSGLAPTRHTLRFTVTDAAGNTSDEAYVPFWLDDGDLEQGMLYFAFIDRLANADPSNDVSEGATAMGGGYEGGDIRGLIDMLPYLDDLGVTYLWISNAQDNAEGAWDGDCGLTYTGYHAYWPDDPYAVEEHFGTDADLLELVDEAHARGMRVMMDWVANHVFETHPYYLDHPEWFNGYAGCKDFVDGTMNFDRIPETCWFAPYLPDIDYGNPEVLDLMVDDALWWAKTYELDGFRVDAVKHMPHAVSYNLQSRVKSELEHRDAGGDEEFWTVGETFDGSRERILAYVGDDQLDAQFDFPLYFTLREAFVRGSIPMIDALGSLDASEAGYGGALMSTFVGNHDVLRFTTDAAEGWQDICHEGNIRIADAPTDPWAYDRLKLAWTFLFTNPGVPLVYYGDELGLPGHGDPDNRQPMWWHTGDLSGGVGTVEEMAGRVQAPQASVARHVRDLAAARAEHPAFYEGTRIQWWEEYDLYAWARSSGSDHALVILNRGESPRQLTNGLSFAGLPTDARYVDVLTGETFEAAGDSITIDVGGRQSRVLVVQ